MTTSSAILTAGGLCLITLSGCARPWNTEFPTPYAKDPRYEERRLEQFDPFAASDLGPQTYTRPRDFTVPRDRTRRSRDANAAQAPPVPGTVPPGMAPPPVTPPPQYPGTVPY